MIDRDGIRCIGDIWLGIDKLGEASEAGNALGVGFNDGVDLFDRTEKTPTRSRKPMKPPAVRLPESTK